jgi:hypothetical protein
VEEYVVYLEFHNLSITSDWLHLMGLTEQKTLSSLEADSIAESSQMLRYN